MPTERENLVIGKLLIRSPRKLQESKAEEVKPKIVEDKVVPPVAETKVSEIKAIKEDDVNVEVTPEAGAEPVKAADAKEVKKDVCPDCKSELDTVGIKKCCTICGKVYDTDINPETKEEVVSVEPAVTDSTVTLKQPGEEPVKITVSEPPAEIPKEEPFKDIGTPSPSELPKEEPPVVDESAKDTFECPECGTKVLKNTMYCIKCKKKVELKK